MPARVPRSGGRRIAGGEVKRPIEPADIRKGDLIRWEQEPSLVSEYAIEYRATEDGYFQSVTGQHYLLDRPSPPVELPTEPTLGWLENVYGARILKHWFRGEGVAEAFDGDRWNFTKEVIAFTPAVAVPKAAPVSYTHLTLPTIYSV